MPTAIAPITGVALPDATGRAAPPAAAEARPGKGLSTWEGDSFSFGDIIDVINPLQHLPVIGTLYRAITGDNIGVAPRLAGSTLYGGPLGLVASLVETAITDITGKSASDYLVAAVDDLFPGDGGGAAANAVAENRDRAEGGLLRTGHRGEGPAAAGEDNWYDDEPPGTDVADITGQSADDSALAEMDFDEVPHFFARIERFERSAPPARATAVAEARAVPEPAVVRPAPGPAFMPSRPVPFGSRALPAARTPAAQLSALPPNRGPADPAAFARLLSAAEGDNGAAPGRTAPLAASAAIARALARYGAAGAATAPLR